MRGLLAIGVAAAVVAVVLWMRDDDSPSRPAGPGATATEEAPAEESAAGSETRPGQLPAPVRMQSDTKPADSHPTAREFAAEDRDMSWSSEKEEKVRQVADELIAGLGETVSGAEIRSVECKTTRCAIAVGGSDSAAVIRLVDAMGDERGFYGVADGVQLTRNGPDEVVVYVRFRQ